MLPRSGKLTARFANSQEVFNGGVHVGRAGRIWDAAIVLMKRFDRRSGRSRHDTNVMSALGTPLTCVWSGDEGRFF